jgi:hypothetical protein
MAHPFPSPDLVPVAVGRHRRTGAGSWREGPLRSVTGRPYLMNRPAGQWVTRLPVSASGSRYLWSLPPRLVLIPPDYRRSASRQQVVMVLSSLSLARTSVLD